MVIIHFLRLIRISNLLIIALAQYLLRYFIIRPLVEEIGIDLAITHLDFFLLSLSTVFIAAAGYAINDYFDVKIDRINKPEKVIVGKYIKRRVAMGAHVVLSILGVLVGGYVSYKVGNINLVFIHIFAVISLWYYSTNFKYQILAGNLVIAMMAALVPLIVGLYEVPLLNKYTQEMYPGMVMEFNFNFNYVAYWTIGFGVFAFLMTLAREITKDIADINGDEACGATTLPIAWGINISKFFIVFFYFLTLAGLISVYQFFLTDKYTFIYLLIFIVSPSVYLIYLTIKGKERGDFLKASSLNKIISLFGILYALIIPFILNLLKYNLNA